MRKKLGLMRFLGLNRAGASAELSSRRSSTAGNEKRHSLSRRLSFGSFRRDSNASARLSK
jgi:hypothetical protein